MGTRRVVNGVARLNPGGFLLVNFVQPQMAVSMCELASPEGLDIDSDS